MGFVPPGLPDNQASFLASLTTEAQAKWRHSRREKKIPADVEFVCVVGFCNEDGDGVVSKENQWSEDLQNQRIPAVSVETSHFVAVRSPETAKVISFLVSSLQPRWDETKVKVARQVLFDAMRKP